MKKGRVQVSGGRKLENGNWKLAIEVAGFQFQVSIFLFPES
jgi:hypothetical protein